MKKQFISLGLLAAFFLFSCDTKPSGEATSAPTETKPKPIQHTYVRTDTVRFEKDSTRWILVGLQKGQRQADSSWKHELDVIFYKGDQQLSYYTDQLQASGEEELLHNFFYCDSNEVVNEQFFTVDFGFPACSYPQQHWMFSIDATGCHFIATYGSSSDSGYGSGADFSGLCGKAPITDISSVLFSSEPDEKQDNLIHLTYSDSVHYHFDGANWVAKAITPKDQVFRKDKEQW